MKSIIAIIGLFAAAVSVEAIAATPAASAAPPATGTATSPGATAPASATHAPLSPKSLMSLDERLAHRKKLRSMTSVDECKAYIAGVEKTMLARAKEKGLDTSGGMHGESCAKAEDRAKKKDKEDKAA